MYKIIIIVIVLVFTRFYHSLESKIGIKFIVPVDIEANMNRMEVLNLSHFSAIVKYVRFDTKEDKFFTSFTDFDISENLIIVYNNNIGCFLYSTEGHFISNIGRVGRGPSEYQYLTLIGFDKSRNINIKSGKDLFEFNKNGSLIKKYSNSFLIDNIYNLYNGFMISDSLLLGHVLNTTGQEKYKALIVNKKGDVKYAFTNYEFYKPLRPSFDGMEGSQTHYYRFKNSIFYKEFFNDTLFSLNEKYELIPKYSFNLGKFKEPLSERAKFILDRNMNRYMYLSFVYQTEKYLFLDCEFADEFPARRLTPITYSNSTKLKWHNTTKILGIYNKKDGNLVFARPTSTDNPLYTSGLYNDVDCGPRFFPRKQVNDSTMAMWIEAKQLKEHVASSDFKNSYPKFPEQKRKLEELANNLTEFDNPVLMLVTFKDN